MGKKDNGKPKRSLSAYMLYVNSVRQDITNENPELKMTQVSTEAARRWKELTDEEKEPFNEEAKELKEKYQQELKEWKENKGDDDDDEEEDEKPKKKRKVKKDANAPKRPVSAYILFVNDIRESIKSENPDFKITEVSVEAGKRWRALTDEEKEPYTEQAAQLKEKYQQDLKEYNENKGDDDDEEEEDEKPKKRRRKAKAAADEEEDEE